MNTAPRTPPEAWRLQVLKHLQANPSLSQRQLAGQMGVSLGKANYCLRALVEKGLVKLGNFRKKPEQTQIRLNTVRFVHVPFALSLSKGCRSSVHGSTSSPGTA